MSHNAPPSPPPPGPELEILASDAGSWDAEIHARPPGGPPQNLRGISERRMTCGGRWLLIDFRTERGDFEGHAIYGYDPLKKKYVATWVDTMRTFLAPMEGTWDAARKTLTFTGEATLPNGTMRWRETTEHIDDDTRRFRILEVGADGSEREPMTITYRRRR